MKTLHFIVIYQILSYDEMCKYKAEKLKNIANLNLPGQTPHKNSYFTVRIVKSFTYQISQITTTVTLMYLHTTSSKKRTEIRCLSEVSDVRNGMIRETL